MGDLKLDRIIFNNDANWRDFILHVRNMKTNQPYTWAMLEHRYTIQTVRPILICVCSCNKQIAAYINKKKQII